MGKFFVVIGACVAFGAGAYLLNGMDIHPQTEAEKAHDMCTSKVIADFADKKITAQILASALRFCDDSYPTK